ncbi:tripartite tricarboxylate transporter substrate binding protein [Ottowia sp.]|uniref:Bug family tripartite tricarboxylate transporter substrate binding protein n=1 Tax=Ottowia sp. TaxID=1898956 RepID=UPI0025E5A91E|nr:tripartite tricarboxylate transporter substrate binding protein [Ottowia sp.]MBK6746266.1 tripartite tricarboxylate transporter substrate binding protein [Ottowia sp.]
MKTAFPSSTLNILATLALLGGAAAAQAQGADGYPSKPVTLVVPTAPAGGTDTIARMFADVFSKAMKQPFIVENRPGANGILGVDYAAKGPADGSRVLFTYTASMVINPFLYKKLPYDPVKDFTPVAQVGRAGNLLLVRKDLPVGNLKEFVAYVKAHPNKLNYCSWGNGSGGHLTMESLQKQAGLTMTHVAYKGSTPCVQDLMGGQVDAAFADISTTAELVKAGRVKAVAYSGAGRLPLLPDVPTMNESGYPFSNYTWYGFFVPAKTPPAIVNKLNAAIVAALKDPAVVKRLHDMNFTDIPLTTPDQFKATIAKDLRDWEVLVKAVGVTLD